MSGQREFPGHGNTRDQHNQMHCVPNWTSYLHIWGEAHSTIKNCEYLNPIIMYSENATLLAWVIYNCHKFDQVTKKLKILYRQIVLMSRNDLYKMITYAVNLLLYIRKYYSLHWDYKISCIWNEKSFWYLLTNNKKLFADSSFNN